MYQMSNKQQLRLNKLKEIKDYLLAEIRERELISKHLSKYIASFEYFNKSLFFLSLLGSIFLLHHLHQLLEHLQE